MAVPLDRVQGVMYYREDLLRQLNISSNTLEAINTGLTWPDFLKLQKQLNWKGPFYIYPAAEFEGLICSYIEILLSLRTNYFEAVGFRFNTPEAKKALQLLVDLVNKYRVTPQIVSDFTEVPSYEYFIRNDGLFLRGWTCYDKDFKDAPFNLDKQEHLKKAQIPYLPEGKPTSLFGGWNLMVSKSSTKKDAVVDFVKFLLSDEAQEIFYAKGGFYPITNSFYNDSTYLRKFPEIQMIKYMMKYGVHRPLQENYTKYSKIMARYFYLAIKGNMSVDEALRRVDASIESEKSLLSGM
jgi:multiple sugar transport system substrate-binding protein